MNDSIKMCRNCLFRPGVRYCQRHAPIYRPSCVGENSNHQWPPVPPNQWCGDWELAECVAKGCTDKREPGYDDIFCQKHGNEAQE